MFFHGKNFEPAIFILTLYSEDVTVISLSHAYSMLMEILLDQCQVFSFHTYFSFQEYTHTQINLREST